MSVRDKIAAALMVLVWGLNFVVIKYGLQGVPPLLLGALRFIFVAFPAIFFLPRPNVPLRLVAAYGLTISFGQFAFLFSALYVGMPTGLASLVLQAQVFISLLLAALIFGERLHATNFAGLALALAGVVLLMTSSVGAQGVPLLGFALTLCAATSWAVGNILNKKMVKVDVVPLVVWSALVPIIPFILASVTIEGVPRIIDSLSHLPTVSVGAVAYLAIGASLVGYSVWGHLISCYPVWKVAPLTLLVPVVGLAAGAVILDEGLTGAQIAGSVVVLAGLMINVFGPQLARRLRA